MATIQLNELQRFIKNLCFLWAGAAVNVLLTIGITAHLSSALQVEGFGRYSFLTAYISYFSLMTALGTDLVAIRMIAIDRSRIKAVMGALLPLKAVLCLVVFLAALAPMLVVPKLASYGWVLAVFALPILILPLSSVSCVFEATKRMEFIVLGSIVVNALNYLFFRLLVRSATDLSTVGWTLLGTAAVVALLYNILFIVLYGRFPLRLEWGAWKELVGKGLVIGFIQITLMLILNMNVFLLAFMRGDHEVGLFSASYRALFMLIQLLNLFHALMSPILFESWMRDRAEYRLHFQKYMKFMIYIGCGVTTLGVFLATPYLRIFYDLGRYGESVPCFQILILSLFFMTLNSPLHVGLLSSHQEKTLLGITTLQMGVNLVGNLLLIPAYGIFGSAAATVVTEAAGLLFYIYYFRKIYPVPLLRDFSTALAAAGCMGLFLHLAEWYPLLELTVGVAILAGATLLLRGVTFGELQDLKRSILDISKISGGQ